MTKTPIEKESKEEEQGTHELIDSYDTFFLEEKKITLPIAWSDLYDMGFRIGGSDEKTISVETKFVEEEIYNESGKYLGKIHIANKTDSDITIKDGIVNVFTFTTDVNMNLYGGLSFLSSKEQVYEACGEPLYQLYKVKKDSSICVLSKEDKENLNDNSEYMPTSSYRWCRKNWFSSNYVFNNNTREMYAILHYLEITFDDNNISEISFCFDSAEDEESQSIEDDDYSKVQIVSSDNYSNDYAWITYSIDSNSYTGCIDKSGMVIFQYQEQEVKRYTEFQNGSACVCFEDGTCSIIDKSGKEIYSPSEHDLGDLATYGDGYYCFTKTYSGFDENGFIATIIDAEGNILKEEKDSMLYSGYAGEGVFYGHNLNKTAYWYYNVEKGIAFKSNKVSPDIWGVANTFENGYSQIELTNGEKNGDINQAIFKPDGECFMLNMPDDNVLYWRAGKVSDNVIVYEGYNESGDNPIKKLCYYDLKKKKFFSMNQYMDKIYDELISVEHLHFSDNRIVIPLYGEDYYCYIAIFDKDWNEIMKPTKVPDYELNRAYQVSYSCGRLVIDFGDGDVVLDEDGKEIFKASDLGYSDLQPYVDDVSMVVNGKYIDKDGNLLFENIDLSKVIGEECKY